MALQAALVLGLVVVVREQPLGVRHRVALAGQDVDEHRVRDAHPRCQRLGLGRDEALEGLLRPADEAVGGLLALDLALLLRVVTRLLDGPVVLDDVVGSLGDDPAAHVEPRPTGPPDDLVELARLEHPLLRAVELRQPGEHDRADRHVDAHAQRVGAADDLEQAVLRELLDEPPVLRQHAGVVHADAVAHETRERAPEARAEAEAADAGRDRVALLARRDLDRHEALRPLEGRRLREVHDVDGGAVLLEQLLDGLVERGDGIRELERHGTLRAGDDGGDATRATGEVVAEHRDVTEGRRHEHELRLGQLEDRHLPRPPAVGLGVEVELVHDDEADVR